MKLEEFLTVVRQRWLGMIVVLALTLLLAGVWTETRQREYTASASGIVKTKDSQSVSETYSGLILAQTMAKSYVMLVTSRPVAEEVIDDLGLDLTPEQLIGGLTATLPTGTVNIRVDAVASTPTLARDIANATVRASAHQIRLYQGGQLGSDGVVTVVPVEQAALPGSPSFPVRTTCYGIALLLGCGLSVLWGLFRQRTDSKLRSMPDIERVGGSSALGVVPTSKPLSEAGRLLGGRGGRMAAEAFRQMRTNLRFVSVDEPPRAIVVTSSVAGEGKSTVAANLARMIARGGDPVVLVDADLRRPSLQRIFDVDDAVGLTQVLAGTVPVSAVLQPGGEDGLWLMPAGRIPHNPSELLGSQRMRALLAELARDHFVIVDSPPLLPVTDAALLSASADGALLVCRANRVRQAHLRQSVKNLAAVDGQLLGLVINGVNSGRRAVRNGYGYYAGASGDSEYQAVGRRRATSAHVRQTETVKADVTT